MKKAFFLISIFVAILAFVNIANCQNLSYSERFKIEKQVDSIFQTNIKAAESLDYDNLSKCVDDKHKAGFITNGIYYSAFDSLVEVAKSKSQAVTKQTITIQKKNISVVTENIVLVSAIGESTIEIFTGNQFNVKFFWSFVYEKAESGWKVIQSHQSASR
jgi:hypothetical protein